MVNSLENNTEFNVVGFIDDNKKLVKKVILNKKIFSSLNLQNLIISKKVNFVFLAMPSIERSKRNQIIHKLNKFKLIVKTLPSISEIIDGRVTVSDIKDINIDDLLNREEVKPDNFTVK